MVDLAASVASQRARINHRLMAKCWQDVARYRRLLSRIRPAVVVETGTYQGWSARFFAGYAPKVITIDLTNTGWHTPDWSIVALAGSSTDGEVVAEVDRQCAGLAPVVVSLDSDHNGEHVLAEMESYAHLVGPGSYMVVEDTIVHWLDEYSERYPVDPYDAVQLFLARHPEWETDTELEEAYDVTHFPKGWLRRR